MNNQRSVYPEEQINLTFSTSDFYQLLATSLQLPTYCLAKAFLDGSYKHDALNILSELFCNEGDILDVEKGFLQLESSVKDLQHFLEEMSREHTRLFYHPRNPALSIYETTFLKKQKDTSENTLLFVSEEALHVEKCYKEAGLILKTREPSDHIVTELEFLMDLYGKMALAMRSINEETIENVQEQIKSFEKIHFGKWADSFFTRLEIESTTLSYQIVAKFAKVGLTQVLLKKHSR